MKLTRYDIFSARLTWANYLQQPERAKAKHYLDTGRGHRCCLGHGCYIMGIPRTEAHGKINYDWEVGKAPESFIQLVGLNDQWGSGIEGVFQYTSLAQLNDDTDLTPQEIGAYLESVIDGGNGTPFIPLNSYPE